MMLSTTRADIETDDASVPRTFETAITVRSEALQAHAAELDQSAFCGCSSLMDFPIREIWQR
jgi:hypothetical protein